MAENTTQQIGTTYNILVDSECFWERLNRDIAAAKECIYIQTLSFEGDNVGKQLSDQIKASPAVDKRIIVDNYTRYVLSDKFLYSPRNWFDADLRQEAKDTAAMIDDLNSSGTRVKFVNPMGPFLAKLPSRNHKKILVIDDRISYIGGINFSEHNFEWHDMMLRIEDDGIAAFLKKDFLTSWEGRHFGGRRKFGGIELFSFAGAGNEAAFEPIMNLIDAAGDSIYVQSPYLCQPFADRLRKAVARGVHVTVVSPEKNNKKTMGGYIEWESARSGFDLRLYQKGMTHLKAMLIDNEHLILGSSNFDYFSYHFEQETVAVITDQEIIAEFTEKVIDHDDQYCRKISNPKKTLSGYLHNLEIKIISALVTPFNRQ